MVPSGHSDAIVIPGEEGLAKGPLHWWEIAMGDRTIRVRASSYEHAVVWLEVWCREQGIERQSAGFVQREPA